MAKKKKAAGKPAAPRRVSRRGKQLGEAEASTSAAETETSIDIATSDTLNQTVQPPVSVDRETPSTSAEPASTNPQTSITLSTKLPIPIVVLHKKFGKYRCLFNNEDSSGKKSDGSDSETNSSVEIRVVDPCASSESDSNTALDNQSDSACGTGNNSPLNSTTNVLQSHSGDSNSSVPIVNLSEVQLPPLINNNTEMEKEKVDQEEKRVSQNEMEDIERQLKVMEEEAEPSIGEDNKSDEIEQVQMDIEMEPLITEENNSEETNNTPLMPEQNLDEQEVEEVDDDDDVDDDDEVITVVQIVEDDNSDYFYDIQINSPKDKDAIVNKEVHNELQASTEPISEFQKHFENLNLANSENMPVNGSECNDNGRLSVCHTPDLLPFNKESSSDFLLRPDPSLTPSSTLSDDSNSSRLTSEPTQNNSNDSAESSPTGVRRSTRIKTISTLKQKTKGYGLVKTPLKKALMSQTKLKLEEIGSDSQEKLPEALLTNSSNSPTFPVPVDMPVKVKSRWRRSSELEMCTGSPAISPLASPSLPSRLPSVPETTSPMEEDQKEVTLSKESCDKIIEERLGQFVHLDENEYLCERMISKETKKMICDCFLTKEEIERGELGCGEDCLNRLLMIECNYRCPVNDRCTNRSFQKQELAPLKVFYADKKGCGVEASEDIPSGEFLMEYVGEVLDYEQFYKRAQAYSDENNLHHYFMSLKGDTVIDATVKGNISRFINHSCDPNAETQKWTVNGELRIGFFSKRDILAGEELTFDYQFQRFGKEAQRCYCGTDNCRGWIGAEPDSDEEEDEEDDDVTTSKSRESSEDARETAKAPPKARPKVPRRVRRKYNVPQAPDLVQDADIEEDIESLSRTGIKNQSHTLRLSRTVVRAKGRPAQASLLRLLRDADLPCRRLFLDYRGLRLLAPWCNDAPLDFKLEMLQTVDRLPIPNKTMIQESRFFTIVERWLSASDAPADPPVFIDEATGLPVEVPNRTAETAEKSKDITAITEKVKELSKQLLERWASLKEVFKIPKKERIQQMKEHERQANVERRAADSSQSRDRDRSKDEREKRDDYRERRDDTRERKEKERDRDRERERERERDRERRERERERDRERDRERERDDRDRRKRRGSPEGGRRSIRLSERVLASVPPMSKEERRRAFAEAAAAAEESRRQLEPPPHWQYQQWPPADAFPQMFPPGMMGGPPNMLGNMSGNMLPRLPGGPAGAPTLPPGADLAPDWAAPFCPPYGPQTYVMPQHNFMGMSGFGMGGFMFGQPQLPFPPQPEPQPMPQPPMHSYPTSGPSSPVVLPSLWRSATDDRGRTYYYHVKSRQPQWTPPPPPQPPPPDESSSDEEEELTTVDTSVVRRQGKVVEGVNGIYEVIKEQQHNGLIPEHALLNIDKPRKRRPGLVCERPISPRTEEDKLAGRMEVKRYKETKEKLRRRREKFMQRVRLLSQASRRNKREITALDLKTLHVDLIGSDSDTDSECEDIIDEQLLQMTVGTEPEPEPEPEPDPEPEPEPEPEEDPDELARRIKEVFRSSMARVMVHHLNPYRHRTAPAGRITNTSDFKHLARKLTHFVMLKELKHCRSVEELVVTDSVNKKAKEFVRKYMAKFGPVYKRPAEEAD